MRRASIVAPLLLVTAVAHAQDKTASPYFFVPASDGSESFPLESTHADVLVSGPIARVRIQQTYQNRGSKPIEAVYVFPLSTRAAVFGLEMKIGERRIVAEIQKREQARAEYEKAKAEGKSATLLEQDRPNLFQMNVANILPGDRVEVFLDYVENATRVRGEYELVYPTVVGPRYGGSAKVDASPPPPSTATPYLNEGSVSPTEFSLNARFEAPTPIASVTSPSHDIAVTSDNPRSLHFSLQGGGNKDVIMRYRTSGADVGTGMLLFPGKQESFFLASIEAPDRIEPRSIPRREYLFVVDVSGSMAGFPLAIAQRTLETLIRRLNSNDRFNILQFAGGSTVLAPESVPVTTENLDRAAALIRGMSGGGATEILPALRTALAMPRADGTSTSIVVLTDGYVTVEKEVYDLVRKNLGQANLFSVGIGSSVNRELVEVLARAGYGESFVATTPLEGESVAATVVDTISSPVLTDIEVRFDGFSAYDVEPAKIPDLFSQQPIVVFGKYRGTPKGQIVVTGKTGMGDFRRSIAVADFAPSDDLVALKYLWARHRIRSLSDREALGDSTGKEAITKLGLEYGLMTAYTSFLAVDSRRRNESGSLEVKKQPLPLPEGVSGLAIGDAVGLGGLGIRGSGAGGGGNSMNSVGFGTIGTKGHGYGSGRGSAPSKPAALKRKEDVRPVVRLDAISVQGSLDKEVIERVLRRYRAQFSATYLRFLANQPGLSGKVVVELTIDANGKVKRARLQSSTLGVAELEKQVLAIFEKIVFPAPAGGGEVIITYPMTFTPQT